MGLLQRNVIGRILRFCSALQPCTGSKSGVGSRGFRSCHHHHDKTANDAQKALGKSAFDKEFHRGLVMTEGEAVAYALDEHCGVPNTSSTEAIRLTRREQQVAELVAQGLTNRAIAENLVISVRTAQGHVEHVLTKMGFTSRAQIAAWVVSTAQERDSREVNSSADRN